MGAPPFLPRCPDKSLFPCISFLSCNVICLLKLLLVCIFRLSCFLLVYDPSLPYTSTETSPRTATASALPAQDGHCVGGCNSIVKTESVVEATREQSGEKLKLKGFVQLCSPKCWRACRSSNVPVKMCAPRRDKIMWLKLTTNAAAAAQLPAAARGIASRCSLLLFLRLVGPHTTK